MSTKELERIVFIGQKTFPYHVVAEQIKPGWSGWAPDDKDLFSVDFDLVLFENDSYNIQQYAKNHTVEKVGNLKDPLLLKGEYADWAASEVTILYDGTKPFKVDMPPENGLKIFGVPFSHMSYCGLVNPNEYGTLIASTKKFLYIGSVHEHLNWVKKADWGQGESYKERFFKESIWGWFNGKATGVREKCEDFMCRHEII